MGNSGRANAKADEPSALFQDMAQEYDMNIMRYIVL